jgi:hypothetical protein
MVRLTACHPETFPRNRDRRDEFPEALGIITAGIFLNPCETNTCMCLLFLSRTLSRKLRSFLQKLIQALFF